MNANGSSGPEADAAMCASRLRLGFCVAEVAVGEALGPEDQDRDSGFVGSMVGMYLPTPTLLTRRLRLRAFSDADGDDLFALHFSPVVLRYWDAPPWSDRARADQFVNGAGRSPRTARGRGWPWTGSPMGCSSVGAA